MRNSSLGKISLLPILAALLIGILACPVETSAALANDNLTYKLSSEMAFAGDSCSSLGISSEVVRIEFSLKWDESLDSMGVIDMGFTFDPSKLEFVRGNYDSTHWAAYSEFYLVHEGRVQMNLYGGRLKTTNSFQTIATIDFYAKCVSSAQTTNLTFVSSNTANNGTHWNSYNEILLWEPTISWSPVDSQLLDGSVTIPAAQGDVCCSTPGDANDDGSANIADATFLIARIFSGGSAPVCCGAADVNSDGSVNISDVVYSIARIFSSGLAPVCGPTGISCN